MITDNRGFRIELPKRESEFCGLTIDIEQMYLTPQEAMDVCELVLADLEAQGHLEAQVPENRKSEGGRLPSRQLPVLDDGDILF